MCVRATHSKYKKKTYTSSTLNVPSKQMHVFTMNYIEIVTLAKQPTKITKREEKNHHPKTKSDRVKVISI